MYISLDRKKNRFLHKHTSPRVVADLVSIEAGSRHVDIFPIDCSGVLRGLTETELQSLWRNTTGQGDSAHHGDALRSVLAEVANRFPTTDVNSYEADVQAKWVETFRDDDGAFKYLRGSSKPAKAPDKLEAPPLVTLTEEEATNASRRRAAPAPLPATGEAVGTGARPAPRPVRIVVQAQRAGKTSMLIFETADQLWEEAGKPKDMPSVLAVRKKVMDQLERSGIKRTTCSSTLGAWQKARI